MKEANRYALVTPTNSLRIILTLLEQHNLKTDIKIKATAHAPSILTHKEVEAQIDADYMITSQPTLVFHGREWIKTKKLLDRINQLQIPDVPLQEADLILPSIYDGKRHRTKFALLNPHSKMFRKMTKEGQIPYTRLLNIHSKFMRKLEKETYRHLRTSTMLMVDVNPGKEEMFSKDFVIGLRQPFMQKVFTTEALWKCTDYEVF